MGTNYDNKRIREIEKVIGEPSDLGGESLIEQIKGVEHSLENNIITGYYGKVANIGFIYFGRCKGSTLSRNVNTLIETLPDGFKPKHAIFDKGVEMNGRSYRLRVGTDGDISITPLSDMVENAALNDYILFTV